VAARRKRKERSAGELLALAASAMVAAGQRQRIGAANVTWRRRREKACGIPASGAGGLGSANLGKAKQSVKAPPAACSGSARLRSVWREASAAILQYLAVAVMAKRKWRNCSAESFWRLAHQ
jgi:hypothetical protein